MYHYKKNLATQLWYSNNRSPSCKVDWMKHHQLEDKTENMVQIQLVQQQSGGGKVA